jgi:hypothetical protein
MEQYRQNQNKVNDEDRQIVPEEDLASNEVNEVIENPTFRTLTVIYLDGRTTSVEDLAKEILGGLLDG